MMCVVLDFGKNVHAFIKVMHGETKEQQLGRQSIQSGIDGIQDS